MYSELLSVPLYVRLPENRGGGTVVEEPVSLIDLAPTVLSLVGLEPLAGMEGRPLPGLPGAANLERPRRGLFAGGSFLGPDQTALIRDGYKYILTHPQGYLGFQDGRPRPTRRKPEQRDRRFSRRINRDRRKFRP